MSIFLRDLISVSIVLGIMIFVHEWGHFIAAKFFGVRVDVFSFGFGPRLFGVKRGDTDYRLSALPFGGYVRMAGDNVVEERTGADYEYLSKPRWQRVVIAIAGPAMNVLLAFLIFWGIYGLVGVPFEPDLRQPADVVAVPTTPPIASGVEPGDRIIAINGEKTPTWEKVLSRVNKATPGSTLSITVQRGASQQTFSVPIPNKLISADSLVGYPKLDAGRRRRRHRLSRREGRPEVRRLDRLHRWKACFHVVSAGGCGAPVRRPRYRVWGSPRRKGLAPHHHPRSGHGPGRSERLSNWSLSQDE